MSGMVLGRGGVGTTHPVSDFHKAVPARPSVVSLSVSGKEEWGGGVVQEGQPRGPMASGERLGLKITV